MTGFFELFSNVVNLSVFFAVTGLFIQTKEQRPRRENLEPMRFSHNFVSSGKILDHLTRG